MIVDLGRRKDERIANSLTPILFILFIVAILYGMVVDLVTTARWLYANVGVVVSNGTTNLSFLNAVYGDQTIPLSIEALLGSVFVWFMQATFGSFASASTKSWNPRAWGIETWKWLGLYLLFAIFDTYTDVDFRTRYGCAVGCNQAASAVYSILVLNFGSEMGAVFALGKISAFALRVTGRFTNGANDLREAVQDGAQRASAARKPKASRKKAKRPTAQSRRNEAASMASPPPPPPPDVLANFETMYSQAPVEPARMIPLNRKGGTQGVPVNTPAPPKVRQT